MKSRELAANPAIERTHSGSRRTQILSFVGGFMKYMATTLIALVITSQAWAQTPYGSCPDRAQTYQERYERSQQSRDLVCYQKALERELSGEQRYSCPSSAQYYQTAYERYQRSSDLVCYQKTLERELR